VPCCDSRSTDVGALETHLTARFACAFPLCIAANALAIAFCHAEL